jgi:adenosylcobinamide-phosphate synthase
VDVGWASARLDDVANWIPARVAAVLLILGGGAVTRRPDRVAGGWKVFRRDGGKHPSPNSGRPEAAMAGVLGVTVGGLNVYDGIAQERPVIGAGGRRTEPGDIAMAARIMAAASAMGVCMAAGIRWLA